MKQSLSFIIKKSKTKKNLKFKYLKKTNKNNEKEREEHFMVYKDIDECHNESDLV